MPLDSATPPAQTPRDIAQETLTAIGNEKFPVSIAAQRLMFAALVLIVRMGETPHA